MNCHWPMELRCGNLASRMVFPSRRQMTWGVVSLRQGWSRFFVSKLILPALEAAAGGMLRLATVVVEAGPLSVALAIALVLNRGGGLSGLWVGGGAKGRPARRAGDSGGRMASGLAAVMPTKRNS